MGKPVLKDEFGRRVRTTNVYTPEIAEILCRRIMEGESLRKVCEDPRMPSKPTVVGWLADRRMASFREMYYQARRIQAELLVDEIMEIADNTENDWKPVKNKKGDIVDWKPDNEAIQRSRVRIDTRKWYAAKMVPKIYGERVDHTLEATGDLAELLKAAANTSNDLPPPIDGECERD